MPDALRTLFNKPEDVRVQKLPCEPPEKGSMVVFFGAGARTVPHSHHEGQHAMAHLTVEKPGDFDLDVDKRDWDSTYSSNLGA